MDQTADKTYSVRNDTPIDVESARLIKAWDPLNDPEPVTERPTYYKDPTPPTPTGAQPVPQHDSRVVPPIATGIAVGGAGIGLMAVGVGAGANLMGAGAEMVFNSITAEDVAALGVLVASPFVLAAGIGIVISKFKAAAREEQPPVNNFHGPTTIEHRTEINQTANRWFTRNISHKH